MTTTNLQTTPKSENISLQIGKAQPILINPQASKILLTRTKDGYRSDEIATLGESDVFVVRDASGVSYLLYKEVTLRVKDKEIANAGSDDKPSWMPTIEGYNKLQQFASLFLTSPPIYVDGREQPNPYREYDKYNVCTRVISRTIAIGYSPGGNLVATDSTRIYDLHAYFLTDLIKKAKFKPDSARQGVQMQCPFAPDKSVIERNGAFSVTTANNIYEFIPIKERYGIWTNVSHKEIFDVYAQHNRHAQYADVTAQSLSKRNAIKAHPAIAKTHLNVTNGEAKVMVYCYRHGMTEAQMTTMADKIVKGEKPQGVQVESDTSEVTEAESVIVDESLVSETGDLDNDESETPVILDLTALRSEIETLGKEKGVDIEQTSKNLFDSRFKNLTQEQYQKLLDVVKSTGKGKQS